MTPKQSPVYPFCFGKLETVFPMGDDGLRHSPESCVPCAYKTVCLRKAMAQKEGLKVREEVVDRAYAAGAIGFLQRWSQKKTLNRRYGETGPAGRGGKEAKRRKP